MIKIKNRELASMLDDIIDNNIDFRKGMVSGFSIEIHEDDPESFTSFTYYKNENERDSDYELLLKMKNEKNFS